MAYAVFQTGAKQYRVSEADVIDVDLLEGDPGSELTFSQILLVGGGDSVKMGEALKDAKIVAEVVEHYRGPKGIAYKYKRRKGYQRKVGYRRSLTKLKIKSITA
jgi:large subunit ribosomal protein L21